MTRELSDTEIRALTDQPFDLSRAELVPGDPDAVKKVLSARVPEAVSQWIVETATAAKISPSALTGELLAEAIAARQRAGALRLVDVDALHRALDALVTLAAPAPAPHAAAA